MLTEDIAVAVDGRHSFFMANIAIMAKKGGKILSFCALMVTKRMV